MRSVAALILIGVLGGCACPRPGALEKRKGDEIVVAGQMFHTGTRVVLWMDPGGYDAYRVERRFVPYDISDWDDSARLRTPNRYGLRSGNLTSNELERVRGGGWDLPALQSNVDQFVLHFDVAGTSRTCFKVLQDDRDLSVHFMCDLDGTIYQTLDLKEKAWHATTSNNRSVGVEIANIGDYGLTATNPFREWYKMKNGKTIITIPERFGPSPERTPGFVGRPVRREPVEGEVQGQMLAQYDYTRQQYRALAKLTAALCKIFPEIRCDYPRDAEGKLINHKLPDDQLKYYHGVMGHYHIQTDKTDPGPALQWDFIIDKARAYLREPPVRTVDGKRGPCRVRLIDNN